MPKTGKQRAQRINRQYHQLVDPFIVRKRWIGVVGFSIAALYSAWLFSSRGKLQLSPGDLSKKHSIPQEIECQACHNPYTPIRNDSLGGNSPANVKQNNQSCTQKCHTNLRSHFESNTKSEVLQRQSCSLCHHEHLGEDHRLTDVSDKNCVRCHDQILSIASDASKTSRVSDFSLEAGHPRFSFESKENDPSTLKFSHVQHLRPGQPSRAGGLDAKGTRQLQCSDCHERDIELPGFEYLEASESISRTPISSDQTRQHRLYRPIEFKKHCVPCHDLNGIEHGLNRAKTQQSINAIMPLLQQQFLRLQREPVSPEELQERELRLNALFSTSIEGCSKCHIPSSDDSKNIVEPIELKHRWLENATFSHGEHLMVNCKHCHSEAYSKSDARVDSEQEANQIMLPGIALCRECHLQKDPRELVSAPIKPHVASADCIVCHRYHVDPPKSSISTSHTTRTIADRQEIQSMSASWKDYLRGVTRP